MVFDCKLCGDTSLTRYICVDCNFIKDAINLYSKETVVDVIKRTLVRNKKQQEYKINQILKEKIGNELGDETYIKHLKNTKDIKKEILDKFK